jgi:RecA-family ATPase
MPPINTTNNKTVNLPPITSARELEANPPEPRPEIIRGVLRERCKMSLGGQAKSRKTWQLMHLGVAVATGTDWLQFETVKHKVLYINFELHGDTFIKRLQSICDGLEMNVPEDFDIWNLRSHEASYNEILPAITAGILNSGYGLIILDPTQKMLGDLDENKSSDVAKMMNALEKVCAQAGASLVITLHYSKGNKAKTNTGERSRGSSVFMGDVDAALEFVAHEDSDESNDVLTVESVLREFAPIKPFCIEWDGQSLFELSGHDPRRLKKAGNKNPIYSADQLADELTEPMSYTEWLAACNESFGIGKTAFIGMAKELISDGIVVKTGKKYSKVAQRESVASI